MYHVMCSGFDFLAYKKLRWRLFCNWQV